MISLALVTGKAPRSHLINATRAVVTTLCRPRAVVTVRQLPDRRFPWGRPDPPSPRYGVAG
jgi:hypothetical protein